MNKHEVCIDEVDIKGYRYLEVKDEIHLVFEDAECEKLKTITLTDGEGYVTTFSYPSAIKCVTHGNKKTWMVKHAKGDIKEIVACYDEKDKKLRYTFKWSKFEALKGNLLLSFLKFISFSWILSPRSGSGGGYKR